MTEAMSRDSKELVLAPGMYAYLQDVTKGTIRSFTGPTVINQTAQEVPVRYEADDGMFVRCAKLEEAVRKSPIAVEGYYLVLLNPTKDGKQPDQGRSGDAPPDLNIGRRVNIPGPVMFPLWPGQAATMIRGHQLSRNEYLKVRVYNEEEARKNWARAVIQPASRAEGEAVTPPQTKEESAAPEDLTVGRMLIIEGAKVSFYIPPTGISVVAEGKDEGGRPRYVRDALTLERLEYCVLVDEDGNKRYERGPMVVFPQPTETFICDDGDNRKFRALELNEIQGIHIKVIAEFKDENGKQYEPGDEFFLTGDDTAIYYPRQEHSLVRYDGRAKHYAIAVPAGEARYVMNRMNGDIRMVKGPAMLLPNPINEVIVRRVLSPKQCDLWYPTNTEVVAFNEALRVAMATVPTTRAGAVSEGDLERSVGRSRSKSLAANSIATRAVASSKLAMESSVLGESTGSGVMADEFSRQSTFTQPRSITLDKTNYGVPLIQPWIGYAVMVVKKDGDRRVVQGPSTILLEYDESLEILELSTGKPKSTDTLFKTAYLRVAHNKVADIVTVITADHVKISFKVSYVVNFEGDSVKWFAIENYVKFLCDHLRSVLKAAAKRVKIAVLDADPAGFVRDVVLGPKKGEAEVRDGFRFPENGMRVCDVEVLEHSIVDAQIGTLLHNQQHLVVSKNIELEAARHTLEIVKQLEEIKRAEMNERATTAEHTGEVSRRTASAEAETKKKQYTLVKELETDRAETLKMEQSNIDLTHTAALARDKKARDQEEGLARVAQVRELDFLVAETKAIVEKATVFGSSFTTALLTISERRTLTEIAEAMSVQRLAGGKDFVDVVTNLFEHNPALKAMFERVSKGAIALPAGGNGIPAAAE